MPSIRFSFNVTYCAVKIHDFCILTGAREKRLLIDYHLPSIRYVLIRVYYNRQVIVMMMKYLGNPPSIITYLPDVQEKAVSIDFSAPPWD